MIHDPLTDIMLNIGFFLAGALIFGTICHEIGVREERRRYQSEARKRLRALENNPLYIQAQKFAERRKEVQRNANLN